MEIRKITEKDGSSFFKLRRQLDEETSNMLYEPGERVFSSDEEKKQIESIINGPYDEIFLLHKGDGTLGGFLGAKGRSLKRIKHVVYIAIGILQEFCGKGWGTRLFEQLEIWALEKGIRRIELTVRTSNAGAINLYKKLGFEIEGTRREALYVDGQFTDEYYMAKILKN